MFKCDQCKKSSAPGEFCNKVPAGERKATYSLVVLKKKRGGKKKILENCTKESEQVKFLVEKENWEFVRGWTSVGREITRERKLCKVCYQAQMVEK